MTQDKRIEMLAGITTQVLLAGEKPFTYRGVEKALGVAVEIVSESIRIAGLQEAEESAKPAEKFAHEEDGKPFNLSDYMTVSK